MRSNSIDDVLPVRHAVSALVVPDKPEGPRQIRQVRPYAIEGVPISCEMGHPAVRERERIPVPNGCMRDADPIFGKDIPNFTLVFRSKSLSLFTAEGSRHRSKSGPDGGGMFFSLCGPRSLNEMSSRAVSVSLTISDTHIPRGGAMPSRRAAMFTPSPRRSPACSKTSPMLIPIRKSIRRFFDDIRISVCHAALQCYREVSCLHDTGKF